MSEIDEEMGDEVPSQAPTRPPASDWSLMAGMLRGAYSDPRAVMNLGAAQWRDVSRTLWGAFGMGPAGAAGANRFLEAKAKSTGLARGARLFMPPSALPGAPLVVMLHGCMQDSRSFAKLTRMDAIALAEGFHVLYPDQESSANPMQCWNWNAPENHHRLGGEPEALAGLIAQAQAICQTEPRLTRMAGISAGGALAASMAHLYPELLGSVAVVAGPAPFSATNVREALREMAEGPVPDPMRCKPIETRFDPDLAHAGGARRRLPMLIVQGWADRTVNPKNAELQERGALMLNEALAGASADGEHHETVERSSIQEGQARVWKDGEGHVVAVVVQPRDLGHAWSGGDSREPFSQPGFDQSRLALDFFEASETGDWSRFHAKDLSSKLFGKMPSHAEPTPEGRRSKMDAA